ncbi:polysaccharide deacetylase family protein [Sunxiuqinia sp. A32]|uniref:polysaccharide deacetylase family protein n=1 Tax=Sunxiuqinia sp. A32 TaxID=3461496 RepID=UPI0040452D61
MLVVYTEDINSRISYIFEYLLGDILHVPFALTTSREEFEAAGDPKLNYSNHKLNSSVRIKPHPLLFEKKLKFQNLAPVDYNDELFFFKTSKNSALPFDPFAASFYLVSRYEEYLEREFEKHRRYPSRYSILSRNKLLQKPVVNQWALIFAEKVKEHFPEFTYKKPTFDFLTTIDIDNAWAYKNKSFGRTCGACIKAILSGNFSQIKERFQVISNTKPDPYETYDLIFEKYGDMPDRIRFFILAGRPGKYDRNVSPSNENFRKLIKKLADTFPVGVHPSYGSVKKTKRIEREIATLEKIIEQKVDSSRQHFLRLVLPTTYRRLIAAGISNDYTMGYSEQIGFRAGTATPFLFYDLKKEEKTDLKIYPFQTMDVTLNDYLGWTPEEAKDNITKIMLEVKKYGGTFISLWHNESLSDQGKWTGWRTVFEEITILALKLKNESKSN